jgi:hypothetical protein
MGNCQPHAVLHRAETVLTAIADFMYNLVVLLQGQLLSTASATTVPSAAGPESSEKQPQRDV